MQSGIRGHWARRMRPARRGLAIAERRAWREGRSKYASRRDGRHGVRARIRRRIESEKPYSDRVFRGSRAPEGTVPASIAPEISKACNDVSVTPSRAAVCSARKHAKASLLMKYPRSVRMFLPMPKAKVVRCHRKLATDPFGPSRIWGTTALGARLTDGCLSRSSTATNWPDDPITTQKEILSRLKFSTTGRCGEGSADRSWRSAKLEMTLTGVRRDLPAARPDVRSRIQSRSLANSSSYLTEQTDF
jgi:hypothetical protein